MADQDKKHVKVIEAEIVSDDPWSLNRAPKLEIAPVETPRPTLVPGREAPFQRTLDALREATSRLAAATQQRVGAAMAQMRPMRPKYIRPAPAPNPAPNPFAQRTDPGVEHPVEPTPPPNLPMVLRRDLFDPNRRVEENKLVVYPEFHKLSNLIAAFPATAQDQLWHRAVAIFGSIEGGKEFIEQLLRHRVDPVSQVRVLADLDGAGPSTNLEIRAVESWIKGNAVLVDQPVMDFSEQIPGYQPVVRVYMSEEHTFLLVAEKEGFGPINHGRYIYMLPVGRGVKLNYQARAALQEPTSAAAAYGAPLLLATDEDAKGESLVLEGYLIRAAQSANPYLQRDLDSGHTVKVRAAGGGSPLQATQFLVTILDEDDAVVDEDLEMTAAELREHVGRLENPAPGMRF